MTKPMIDVLDESRSPSKTILILAWPAIIEQLLQTLVGYVDTAMVGSMGADATAAVAMTTSLTWLVNGLMNAAALGFSVQVARSIGSHSMRQARRIVKQALFGYPVRRPCFLRCWFSFWLGPCRGFWSRALDCSPFYQLSADYFCCLPV